MTTARNFSGSCNMHIETSVLFRALAIGALLVWVAADGYATEPPPAADLPVSQDAEAAHQVQGDQVRFDWRLDPAIFTDISPVNAPDIAVKLPADQRDDE